MDKYDRAFARHRQKKRRRRTTIIICACSIALGYVLANECIKEHKRLYSDHDSEWGKGDAAEIKRYPDRSVSIRYENGQWFHYLEVSGEIVWDQK